MNITNEGGGSGSVLEISRSSEVSFTNCHFEDCKTNCVNSGCTTNGGLNINFFFFFFFFFYINISI
jgi:hypothetical protein